MLKRNFFSGILASLGLGFLGVNKKADNPPSAVIKGKSYRQIRVWTLGSMEHKVYPTPEAIQYLADVLARTDKADYLNLIWGPELHVQSFLVPEDSIDVILTNPAIKIINKDTNE